jgi:hypothetical protein
MNVVLFTRVFSDGILITKRTNAIYAGTVSTPEGNHARVRLGDIVTARAGTPALVGLRRTFAQKILGGCASFPAAH